MVIRPTFIVVVGTWLALANSTEAAEPRESRPGRYEGYSAALYDGHSMSSQYVSVRDGTRLAIDIFRPTRAGAIATEKLPVLWMNTPYNRRNYRDGLTVANYPGKALELVKYGYVVAVADFRGLYASFGRNAGFNRGEWQDWTRFDAYDITEWLAKQSWSSGKVGMWGCSATGGSQMQAMTTAPPSLKAIFPMSCEWDVFGFVAAGGMTPPQGVPTQIMRGGSRAERDKAAVPVDGAQGAELLSAAIAEHQSNLETPGSIPFRDSTSAEFKNQWWLKSSPHTYASTIAQSNIAVYAAANWDEGATGYGAAFTFNNLVNPKKLILGPATHCDWTTVQKETGFSIIIEELRFFDHWLKGTDNGVMREPAVTYYTYNAPAGREWQSSATWPLANEKRTDFYLSADALSATKPQPGARDATVDYTVNNENFWDKGMSFTTAPLDRDLQVTGHSVVTLWVSSSSSDADVIARLDDVAPDGSHRYYSVEGKLRASLRKTAKPPYNNLGLPWHPFTQASVQPLRPGDPVEMSFDLYATSYVFKAGHRVRLTLNFADQRNSKKETPAPTVKIHFGNKTPSALTLPVIER
jgi:predicted acyl esterase